MALTKLQFRPGINRDFTSYANEGGWRDCDKVRFYLGLPEKIGGWDKYSDETYQGNVRSLHNWIALDGSNFLGVGSHLKYYIEEGGEFNDITPIRTTFTTTDSDNCVETTSGSAVVKINITNHDCFLNDFVTISGVNGAVGGVPQAELNAEHQVTHVVDGDTFEITVSTAATSTVASGGGTAISVACQLNVGLDTTVGGTGWGAGTWGRGGWGSAEPNGLTTTNTIRLWSEDNFGEDLLINPRDEGIYYWDKSNGISTRAVALNTRSGTKRSIPTIAKRILVSDQDRHVIAFGCDGLGGASDVDGDGVQDPLLIRFSDQEDPLNWYPATDNTAGDLRLGSGSTFVQAVETKREILVFTDTAIFSMRYIGPPFTFGLTQLAASITIAGPNAVAATEDFVFWMGVDNFYVYAGQTQQLPCTVKEHVFSDLNPGQTDKITAGVNSEFSEVWWFYPSVANSRANGGDDECDKYVIYNYREKIWYIGTMKRTAWIDRGTRQYPIAAADGYLYNHEFGNDDDGSPMSSFIESANMDIGDGHHFTLIQKVLPDLTFGGSDANSAPQATFEIKSRNNPGEDFGNTSSGITTRTSSAPVEKFTSQLNLRSRGRSFALKVSSDSGGTKWKLGAPRVDIRQDGRR